jgi:hypothetical protein
MVEQQRATILEFGELLMFVVGGFLPLIIVGVYLDGGANSTNVPTFDGLVALLKGIAIFYIGLFFMFTLAVLARTNVQQQVQTVKHN